MPSNYGFYTRVGNVQVTGGPQAIGNREGAVCDFMGNTFTVKYDNLHICKSGPISGQYITIHRDPTETDPITLSEVYIWDTPQPADQSDEHGETA